MKQPFRLFLRPHQFVNQLQWSTHHWFILLSFLVITAIESQVGRHHSLYQTYAQVIAANFNLSLDIALWLVISMKLCVILAAGYAIAHLVWFTGNLFGQKNSKRVLFRRLAVVFTLLLAGYTGRHLQSLFPWMNTASLFLAFWGVLLGYFTLREQFLLTHKETAFVGLFTLFLVFCSWHYAHQFINNTAREHISELSQRPVSRSKVSPKF